MYLQSYLDGELDSASAQEVAAHLDICERCELESSVYHSIKASLASLDRPIDPEILQRLQAFAERVVIDDPDN